MPVVLRHGGVRYLFFSNEGDPREPPHVHARGGGKDAKVWLEPEVELAASYGFTSAELRDILSVVQRHRANLIRAWHGYFGDSGSI